MFERLLCIRRGNQGLCVGVRSGSALQKFISNLKRDNPVSYTPTPSRHPIRCITSLSLTRTHAYIHTYVHSFALSYISHHTLAQYVLTIYLLQYFIFIYSINYINTVDGQRFIHSSHQSERSSLPCAAYYVQLLSSSPIILSCVSLLLLLLRLLLFLLLTSSSASSIFVSPPTESSFILPFLFFYFLIYFFLFVSFDINVLSHAKRSAPPLSPLYNLDQGAGFLANGISDRSSKRHADAF